MHGGFFGIGFVTNDDSAMPRFKVLGIEMKADDAAIKKSRLDLNLETATKYDCEFHNP